MKKLLAILLCLMVSPAFGQEIPPPPVPQDTTYNLTFQPAGAMLQFVDQSGGTLVSVGDDVSTLVPLGFDFTYFGNIYNSVWVSSNGFISFTDSYHGCCGGYLENGSPNTIYAYWADLYSDSTYFKTYKVQGQDIFTAGWYNVYELGNPGNLHNFEISLFSGTNDFSIVYGNNVQPTYPYSAGYIGPLGETYTIQSYSLDQTAISNTTYSFSLAPIQPPTIDCTLAPSDPSCTINNIIDQVTNPDTTVVADTGITPEESLALFEEPITETPAEETTTVEEQPLEELLADVPDPVENIIEENVIEETIIEEEVEQELVAEVTQDAAQESASEATGAAEQMDANLLSLVLSIVESTSATSSAAATGSSNSTVSSSSNLNQSSVANSNAGSVEFSNNMNSDLVSMQQEQVLFAMRNDLNINSSQSDSSSQSNNQIDNLDIFSANNTENVNILNSNTSMATTNSTDVSNPVSITPTTSAFNVAMQEAAGVLNFEEAFKVETKEDSEENFMGEDQTATIDSMNQTDFSSYRSAMLFDASVWYKPEDIYKSNKISDNVRSLYFMEKSSSDTFNQMVQEQYK